MRRSTVVKPSPEGKVPNEERRKRCSTQGVSSPKGTMVKASPPHPGSLSSPTFPPGGRQSPQCQAFPLGEGGPEGRKRCSTQGASSPNGTMLKASPPHPGSLRSPTFPPGGRQSPQCQAFPLGEGGPEGRKRCSTQDVPSPNGTMLEASPPHPASLRSPTFPQGGRQQI